MPSAPGRACPRCGSVVPPHDPCPVCAGANSAAIDRDRGSAAARGYGRRHRRRFRTGVLDKHPVCVLCRRAVATVADHWPRTRRQLVAAGADPDDPAYGRGLCASCHSRETTANPETRGGWNLRD